MLETKQERDDFTHLLWSSGRIGERICQRVTRLCAMVDELQTRAETAEKERDTLAARVKELEDGLRGLQSMGMHSVYTVLDEARRILERK